MVYYRYQGLEILISFQNWAPGFFAKLLTTTWRLKSPSKPLQLISCTDIGIFAAMCFCSSDEWDQKALGLAGSEVSFADANKIFKEQTGLDGMPETYEFLSKGLTWMIKDVSTMFEWFANEGYGADIPALKKLHPGLMSWGEWLQKESGWVTK